MSSKYPGHMMGNLMSDCQELVYSGFVPVPDDLDELGDSNPVAIFKFIKIHSPGSNRVLELEAIYI